MSGDSICAKLMPLKNDSSINSTLSTGNPGNALQGESSAGECRDSPATPHNKFHTNIKILVITAMLFAAFVIAEIIGAIISNSLSLLGDAAAMSVDVFAVSENFVVVFPPLFLFLGNLASS
jgi:hypothetical protein